MPACADQTQGSGASALESITAPQLAMAAGASEELVKDVAMATVLAPAVATLTATPAAAAGAGTPDAQVLPSAVSDNDQAAAAATAAAAASTQVLDRSSGGDDAEEEANGGDKMALAKEKVKEAWLQLPKVFPDAFLLDGSPVAFLTSENDTQCWIHRNTRLKQVRTSPAPKSRFHVPGHACTMCVAADGSLLNNQPLRITALYR